MRISKFLAPAFVAFALCGTGAAMADGLLPPLPPGLPLFQPARILDFYVVEGSVTPVSMVLCVAANPQAAGHVCTILADGVMPVGITVLVPGNNYILVPNTGAASYTAIGPGMEPVSCTSQPTNPGIN